MTDYLPSSEYIIRATPKTIKLSESYEKKITQDMTPRVTDGENAATGQIELVVPYDGHQFFTRLAKLDARNYEDNEPMLPSSDHHPTRVSARMGYLHIRNGGKTNLPKAIIDEQPDQLSNEDMMPIDVVLSEGNNRHYARLDDRQAFKYQLNYVPDASKIKVGPKMEVKIFDEKRLDAEADKQMIINQLREQAPLTPFLTIPLFIEMVISCAPIKKKKEGEPEPPPREFPEIMASLAVNRPLSGIKYIDLYPVSESESETDQVHPFPFVNNPEDGGTIAWTIPLNVPEIPEEGDSITYKSEQLKLLIEQPVTFAEETQLRGALDLTVPWLLSDLNCLYFDAYGKLLDADKFKQESKIKVSYEINLSRFAQDRWAVSYKQLHFPDVKYDQSLHHAIRQLLQEYSFTVIDKCGANIPHDQMITDSVLVGQHKISSQQLFLHIHGDSFKMKEERYPDHGQDRFSRMREKNWTTVYMGGQSEGGSDQLVTLMNQIHERLEQILKRRTDEKRR